jgi:hypothetical protein
VIHAGAHSVAGRCFLRGFALNSECGDAELRPGDRRIVAEATGRRIRAVSAERVAPIPECVECRRVSLPLDEDRRRCDLDTDDELVFVAALRRASVRQPGALMRSS